MSYLFVDIETRIDKALIGATRFHEDNLTEDEAYERVRTELRQLGSDFFPISYHVPISIGLGTAGPDRVLREIEVLRADAIGEAAVVRAFWERIEAHDGVLVSFNGRGFDLPVLELQALRHGCAAPRYFDERNGLRSRSGLHCDLYDLLTNHGISRLKGGLDLLAKLIGLPGKSAVSGRDVQALWETGRVAEIHDYCRKDVIQTYFLFLHVERLRGRLTPEELRHLIDAARAFRLELQT